MPATTRSERRRTRIEALIRADPARSNRSIAAQIGHCSHNTVARVRAGLRTAENGPAGADRGPNHASLAPPPIGNHRAQRHGAYSAAVRAPLEDEHREQLRQTYPNAPDGYVNAAATRLSMIDLFGAWLRDRGAVHEVRGLPVVSDPARELRRLLVDHEAAIARLEQIEHEAGPSPQDKLDVVVREIVAARSENGDADGGE